VEPRFTCLQPAATGRGVPAETSHGSADENVEFLDHAVESRVVEVGLGHPSAGEGPCSDS
jgi:hypothetical protein